jgi:succinate dehydrogenase / fumarate reductase cytochrome b subunit
VSGARIAFLAGFAVLLVVIAVVAVAVSVSVLRATGEPATRRVLVSRARRLAADRAERGTWAFVAHRVSGVAVFLFLVLHLVDVGLYAISPATYDDVHGLFATPVLRVFECALLFAILFHALNGVRLLIQDLGDVGPAAVSRLLTAVVLLTLVLGTAGSVVILAPVLT